MITKAWKQAGCPTAGEWINRWQTVWMLHAYDKASFTAKTQWSIKPWYETSLNSFYSMGERKLIWKDYILCDFNYMTFGGGSMKTLRRSVATRGWGSRGLGVFRAVPVLYMILQWWVRHYACVQAQKIYNTESESKVSYRLQVTVRYQGSSSSVKSIPFWWVMLILEAMHM